MKKVMLIFLVLLLTMLAGCNKPVFDTSPEYNPETDCQYYNCGFGCEFHLAETEDSIFYIARGYIKVIDKSTMLETFLCNKPNCLHDQVDASNEEERVDCNAFIAVADTSSIFYYDGYIYCNRMDIFTNEIGNPDHCVSKFKLDGSGQQRVWTIDWEGAGSYRIGHSIPHRGKLYTVVQEDSLNGCTLIVSYDLKTKKTAVLLKEPRIIEVNFIGDMMFLQQLQEGTRNYDTLCYRLSTGEVTKLEGVYRVLPVEGGFLQYRCHTDATDSVTERMYEHSIYTMDYDLSNVQSYPALDLNDGKPWQKIVVTDGTRLFTTSSLTNITIDVYDIASGEKISSLICPEQAKDWGWVQMSTTRDGKLLLYTSTDGTRIVNTLYCDIAAIGTPDFQWYEVEKVN